MELQSIINIGSGPNFNSPKHVIYMRFRLVLMVDQFNREFFSDLSIQVRCFKKSRKSFYVFG